MALRNAGLHSSRNLKNLKECEAYLTRPATLQAGGGGFNRFAHSAGPGLFACCLLPAACCLLLAACCLLLVCCLLLLLLLLLVLPAAALVSCYVVLAVCYKLV